MKKKKKLKWVLSECSHFFFEITFMIFPKFLIGDGRKEVAKTVLF